MISRRNFLLTGSLVAMGSATPPHMVRAASSQRFNSLSESLAQLEKESNGRLGVAVLDTGSGESSGHRTNERFAMCSTFKMLLAAAVLQRVDTGKENLDRTVTLPAEFLSSSPITKEH